MAWVSTVPHRQKLYNNIFGICTPVLPCLLHFLDTIVLALLITRKWLLHTCMWLSNNTQFSTRNWTVYGICQNVQLSGNYLILMLSSSTKLSYDTCPPTFCFITTVPPLSYQHHRLWPLSDYTPRPRCSSGHMRNIYSQREYS